MISIANMIIYIQTMMIRSFYTLITYLTMITCCGQDAPTIKTKVF